jgi:hypothetical protein
MEPPFLSVAQRDRQEGLELRRRECEKDSSSLVLTLCKSKNTEARKIFSATIASTIRNSIEDAEAHWNLHLPRRAVVRRKVPEGFTHTWFFLYGNVCIVLNNSKSCQVGQKQELKGVLLHQPWHQNCPFHP